MGNRFQSLITFLRSFKKTILLVIIVAVVSITVSSLIAMHLSSFSNFSVPSFGTIKTIGVEVYWDSNLSNKTERIDWGTSLPGSTKNVTLYIQSASNLEVTLNLSIDNWQPDDLADYLNIFWDYNGTSLAPDESTPVTLSMSTSSSTSMVRYLIENNVQNFNFDIHFVAVE